VGLQDRERAALPLRERGMLRIDERRVPRGGEARARATPDAAAVHLAMRAFERGLERFGERRVVGVVAQQVVDGRQCRAAVRRVRRRQRAVETGTRRGLPRVAWRQQRCADRDLGGELLEVVGEDRACAESVPGGGPPRYVGIPDAPAALRVRVCLGLAHRPQQAGKAARIGVVARHHVGVRGPELAVDDRVDDRVEGEVARRRQRPAQRRVPQQHVQELVAEDGLHVLRRAAVAPDEAKVDQQPRALLARDGQRRHGVGELDREDLQHRADRERVLVDELVDERADLEGVHA
jgi:hypothetical protein